jgi:ribosomal protein L10
MVNFPDQPQLYFREAGKGEVKFGFFEKAFVDAPRVLELAALPGRPVLEARLVSQLSSPLYRFASVLNGNVQRLVSVLNQVAKVGGGELKDGRKEG